MEHQHDSEAINGWMLMIASMENTALVVVAGNIKEYIKEYMELNFKVNIPLSKIIAKIDQPDKVMVLYPNTIYYAYWNQFLVYTKRNYNLLLEE